MLLVPRRNLDTGGLPPEGTGDMPAFCASRDSPDLPGSSREAAGTNESPAARRIWSGTPELLAGQILRIAPSSGITRLPNRCRDELPGPRFHRIFYALARASCSRTTSLAAQMRSPVLASKAAA